MTAPDVLDVDFASREGRALLDAVAHRHGAAIAQVADRLSRGFLFRSAWAPGLCVVGAQADIRDASGQHGEKLSFGGAGISLDEATVSCLGEAAERISQVERGNDVACRATLAEVEADVPPQVSALVLRLLGPSSRSMEVPLDWVAARDLAGREVFVPADWSVRRAQPGRVKIPGAALSVGCAAGPTAENACLRALLESVERDAVSLWWKGGRRAVALDAFARESIAGLVGRLRGGYPARRTSFLDVTTDIGIPAVVAFSTDDSGGSFVAGFGARFSAADAAAAALTELCQMELGLQLAMLKRDQLGTSALTSGDIGHLNRAAGIHVAGDRRFHAAERSDVSHDVHDIGGLRQAFERCGVDAMLVDLTRGDIGVAVVKSVAPALQQLPSDIETERLRSGKAANADALPLDAIELA